MAKRFNARDWVEHEVEDLMDLYGGTRAEQLEFVHDQLVADEYRDELLDSQAFKAAVAAQTLLQMERKAGAK